jgi:VWFA-related protein
LSSRPKRFIVALAFLGLAAAQSIGPDEIHSQTVAYAPPVGMTLRTEVRVVEVPVVVRDPFLHAVDGLTRDDFEIHDNGRRQTITSFSVEHFVPGSVAASGDTTAAPPRPRFLALVFDDVHLLPEPLPPLKEAAKKFVAASLAPGDRAAVVRTSRSEKVDFISDAGALAAQIDRISPALVDASDDRDRCPHITPVEAYQLTNDLDPGGQVLHAKMAECIPCFHYRPCTDREVLGRAQSMWARVRQNTSNALGVVESLVDGMAHLPGQRIIILTSGGFLTGTLEKEVERLMEKARHAEVMINGLDARGLYLNASAGMAYDGVGIVASGTGGTFFHNNNNMELGFRELGMRPETSYLLGFAPSEGADGKFHQLKVQLAARKDYSVEARLGYTAAASVDTGSTTMSKLDRAVLAPDALADLPATFTWEQWDGPPAITMIVHLDFQRLHFNVSGGRRTQKLAIVATLADSRGNFVSGKRSVLDLNLKDATFERFVATGFTTALTIKVPPGNYSVRAVAEDALDGKLAASGNSVVVK